MEWLGIHYRPYRIQNVYGSNEGVKKVSSGREPEERDRRCSTAAEGRRSLFLPERAENQAQTHQEPVDDREHEKHRPQPGHPPQARAQPQDANQSKDHPGEDLRITGLGFVRGVRHANGRIPARLPGERAPGEVGSGRTRPPAEALREILSDHDLGPLPPPFDPFPQACITGAPSEQGPDTRPDCLE